MTKDKRAWLLGLKAAWAETDGARFHYTGITDAGIDRLISEVEEGWAEVEHLKLTLKAEMERGNLWAQQAEAAEKDAAYQRRHRKWALKQGRAYLTFRREIKLLARETAVGMLRRRTKAAEADRDRLAQRVKVLEEAFLALYQEIRSRFSKSEEGFADMTLELRRIMLQARAALSPKQMEEKP